MTKKLNFQCWNCPRTYSVDYKITKEQKLFVRCPYCKAEGVVDLRPYDLRKAEVIRGDDDLLPGDEQGLPEILPTQERE